MHAHCFLLVCLQPHLHGFDETGSSKSRERVNDALEYSHMLRMQELEQEQQKENAAERKLHDNSSDISPSVMVHENASCLTNTSPVPAWRATNDVRVPGGGGWQRLRKLDIKSHREVFHEDSLRHSFVPPNSFCFHAMHVHLCVCQYLLNPPIYHSTILLLNHYFYYYYAHLVGHEQRHGGAMLRHSRTK